MIRALLIWICAASSALAGTTYTDGELAFIAAMGPWPPQATPDPNNARTGRPEAIAYGRKLFHDRRLSAGEDISCATCHQPDRAFTDGLARGRGAAEVDRNAPSLANLGQWRWFGWDGRSDTLWEQSIHPIISTVEMGLAVEDVPGRLNREDYETVFAHRPDQQPSETVLVNVGKALAAYQETLVTPRTQFDAYRDHLIDDTPAPAYPVAARRGLKLFTGKGRCAFCHFGPTLSNGEFHDIGLPFFVDGTRVDPGRHGGITAYLASPFTRAGPYSDAPAADRAKAPGNFVARQPRNWGEFRVPSLRNVGRTAPYMHNGSLSTLEEVVRHYSELDLERLHSDGESLLKPLALSDREIADLVAFLETLTGDP